MSKLTDREIVRLHQMSRSGATNAEIASAFEINRNTVHKHLLLRVQYSSYVLNALCLNATMPQGRVLQIYDASAYLPGWPSDARVYRLYQHGVLAASKRRIGARQCLVARMSDIRRAALRMLPAGLWVRSDTFSHYCDRPYEVLSRCEPEGRDCTYWPSREFKYMPAPLVFETARLLDRPVKVPLPIRTRAAACLQHVGVATI